jgi:hypothetical protein
MTYSETLEERDGYRVRLEVDDSADKPYDDGATPILTIERVGYGTRVEAFNPQAEAYVSAVAEVLDRHDMETVERFVKIFYGAIKMDTYWSDGIRGYYVAFDTAEWRAEVGATPERLKDENYLSEVEAWATGDVYGFIVERNDSGDSDDWEETDSCWGFYGHEYAEQAAREALTAAIAWDKAHPKPAPVPAEAIPARPTLKDEAERLLSYWEQHGEDHATVAKWAISDMLGILRYILEDVA